MAMDCFFLLSSGPDCVTRGDGGNMEDFTKSFLFRKLGVEFFSQALAHFEQRFGVFPFIGLVVVVLMK